MQSKVNFIYKLDGNFTDQGIDIKQLSPILFSLGELIQESNSVLNPNGREISVNVKPFKEGSFIVDIFIFSKTNAQQMLDMVTNDGVKDVKELLEWIGLIRGGIIISGLSLIKLMSWLNGKPKNVEKIDPNTFSVTNKNDESKNVNQKVIALFSRPTIQQSIYNIAVTPNKIQNVKKVVTSLKDDNESIEEITKETSESLEPFEKPIEIVSSETVNISEVVYFLKPKQGSYEGSKGPYSFRIPASSDTLSKVTILDEKFSKKLESGEIRLHKSDLLKARVRITQKKNLEEFTPPQYEIISVEEYTPALKQTELFDEINLG